MDKIFKISHSKMKLARKCHRAYYYKYILKLRKRLKSRPLLVGSLVHECLESYFKNGNYMPVIKEWREKEFNKMFKEEQALHHDIIPLTKSLIRGYISNWKDLNLEMEWVEKEFEVEIAPGIFLIGKIDGKAKEKGTRRKWLVEHKTCKKMPGEEVRMYDTQAILYSQVMLEWGETVTGVMWDYLRTKLPMRPELLKSGGLSTRKNIDTTAEVYLREIKRHGYDPAGYSDILEELHSRRDSFYRQVKLPFNKRFSETIMTELTHDATQLRDKHQSLSESPESWTRNLTRDCSWCDYSSLCYAELRNEDTDYLLKHDYVRSKDEKEIPIQNIED